MQLVIWVVVCPPHVVRSCFSETLYITTLAHSALRGAVADTAAVGVVNKTPGLGTSTLSNTIHGVAYKAPKPFGRAPEATDTRQHERQ